MKGQKSDEEQCEAAILSLFLDTYDLFYVKKKSLKVSEKLKDLLVLQLTFKTINIRNEANTSP